MSSNPNPRKKRRFWRLCRIYFRRIRIAVWTLILALLLGLIYLNQIGLPGFIKQPLLEELRAQGIDLQFTRLRLRWYSGIVAEKVRFGRSDDSSGPQLTLDEVRLELNARALARLRLQIDGLGLRQGRLVWPLAETNQRPRELVMEDIHTKLRLLPGDQWELDNFTASFAGARFQVSGQITNASAVRSWNYLAKKRPGAPVDWQKRLNRFADVIDRIQFLATPEFRLDVRGDAISPQYLQVVLLVTAPGAITPWGTLSEGRFSAHVFPASNDVSHAELTLDAREAQTPWGNTTNVVMSVNLDTVQGQTNQVAAKLSIRANQIETKWATGSKAQIEASWIHALTNPIPISGQGKINVENPKSPWASANKLDVFARFSLPPGANNSPPPNEGLQPESDSTRPSLKLPPAPDPTWVWWTNIAPYLLDWQCHVQALQTTNLQSNDVQASGTWKLPELSITNLQARLYEGELKSHIQFDVLTRRIRLGLISDVDLHHFDSMLTTNARKWLADYKWKSPPRVSADISLTLPEWTNRHPNWRAELQPKLVIDGEFQLPKGGAYRGIEFTSAHSHFGYSNLYWLLPDLQATRPEGKINAQHLASDLTKDYYWRIHSTLDPKAIRPLLSTNQQKGLEFVSFSQPPTIDAEIRGRWHDEDKIGVNGTISATNFICRGMHIDNAVTALEYTNRHLVLKNGRVNSGTQHLSADSFALDFDTWKIFVTNGLGTGDPMIICGAIGTNIVRVMEPYHFLQPPTARVYGVIPMKRAEDADLHFEVQGGAFNWLKYNAQKISGQVHWVGQHLSLENISSECYGGHIAGSAEFEFHPLDGTDLNFKLTANDLVLRSLMTDISLRPNQLEGILSGNLAITHANTADWQTTVGNGNLQLRDGLIWDIPVFGLFSPVLNGISPGMGNSRATAGVCDFIITNGVIHSDDMELYSAAMRLKYRGTVDFQRRVNARVEAELLRDVWGVGSVMSAFLWPVSKLLEYKVTGTLDKPKSEPVMIPTRLFLMPFHPFRTLKQLFPEENNPPPTPGAPLRPTEQ